VCSAQPQNDTIPNASDFCSFTGSALLNNSCYLTLLYLKDDKVSDGLTVLRPLFAIDALTGFLFIIALSVLVLSVCRKHVLKKENKKLRKFNHKFSQLTIALDVVLLPLIFILTVVAINYYNSLQPATSSITHSWHQPSSYASDLVGNPLNLTECLIGVDINPTSSCTPGARAYWTLQTYDLLLPTTTVLTISGNNNGARLMPSDLPNVTMKDYSAHNYTYFDCDESLSFFSSVEDNLFQAMSPGIPFMLVVVILVFLELYVRLATQKLKQLRHDQESQPNQPGAGGGEGGGVDAGDNPGAAACPGVPS